MNMYNDVVLRLTRYDRFICINIRTCPCVDLLSLKQQLYLIKYTVYFLLLKV